MKYLSVCSGIEAATVAWHPLGWTPAAFSEIEPFPASVLAHHYPTVPNMGDMTKFKEWNLGSIDLLIGGTPCQSYSIAGERAGLDDPRGQLMLTYLAIAGKYKPRWVAWENVPGVLSSNGGRDFGALIGGLAKRGYGFAYRILDAQYFGLAQRRKRVIVIGCLGDWRRAAAVLLERESLLGNFTPPQQWVYPTLDASTGWRKRFCNQWAANGFGVVDRNGKIRCATLKEWERLQGFPEGYVSDMPRTGSETSFLAAAFKAIGNSMPVPMMRWIGERIQAVEDLGIEKAAA